MSGNLVSLNNNQIHFCETLTFLFYLYTTQYDLQFIMSSTKLPFPSTEVRHIHNPNHQTCPTGEMCRPLPLSCLGIILFPGKVCLLPRIIHRVDKVEA